MRIYPHFCLAWIAVSDGEGPEDVLYVGFQAFLQCMRTSGSQNHVEEVELTWQCGEKRRFA